MCAASLTPVDKVLCATCQERTSNDNHCRTRFFSLLIFLCLLTSWSYYLVVPPSTAHDKWWREVVRFINYRQNAACSVLLCNPCFNCFLLFFTACKSPNHIFCGEQVLNEDGDPVGVTCGPCLRRKIVTSIPIPPHAPGPSTPLSKGQASQPVIIYGYTQVA